MKDTIKHIHISAEKKAKFSIKEILQYKDLIVLFTRRDFKLRYAQTILGPLWLFLTPLLSGIIYTFVFGNVLGISVEGVPPLLFYLLGNTLWQFFSTNIIDNSKLFVDNAILFNKIYFPRLVVPLSHLVSNIFLFLIQIILFVIAWVYYIIQGSISPNYSYLILLPFLLLMSGLFGIGLGLILSSLTVKYRDLNMLIGFGMSLFMYITPVLYPMENVTNEVIRVFMWLNPMSVILEIYRKILFDKGIVELKYIVISIIITVLTILLGIILFNKTEKSCMDVV